MKSLLRRFKRIGKKLNRNYTKTVTRVGQIVPGQKNIKTTVDIRKLAEIRAKNKPEREALSSKLKRMGRRKRRKEARKRRTALRRGRSPYIYVATKLKTDGSEYVIGTGDDFVGYYHIHDNETVCTEAIHIKNRSQSLIAKEEYIENREGW